MTNEMLAEISGSRAIAVTVALSAGAIFLLGTAYMLGRKPRRPGTPDIPPAMRPGPTDEELESTSQWRLKAWAGVLVVILALWIPLVWLIEPSANAHDQRTINEEYVQQGSQLVQLSSKDNPAGYGCVRCHGSDLGGGFNYFNGSVVRVPNLQTVCGGPNANPPHVLIKSLTDIVNTIAQGRTGTDMPSWSVKYAGALDDEQINAIVNYILTIQKPVPGGVKNNVCLNPIKS